MQQQLLSSANIKFLTARFNLTRQALKVFGIIISVVLLLVAIKLIGYPLILAREMPSQSDVTLFLQCIGFGGFVFGTIWAIFTFFERKIKRLIDSDIAGGFKICKEGCILKLIDSSPEGAAKIQFLETGSETGDLFALQSTREIDLLTRNVRNNIKSPNNYFYIEYAPNSRILLKIDSLRND